MMREFFHGWRRKVGCVALVYACMATILWIQSFAYGVTVDDIFLFKNGMIHFVDYSNVKSHAGHWGIPCWSLVLPLTLLSAYLILWKPRKRTGQDNA